MSLGAIVFVIWNLLMVLTIVIYILWAKENGMFKNIEKPKFDMLEDREPLPWPGRERMPINGLRNKKNLERQVNHGS